ncbi:hypothetical protein [Weizmannia acidilactici]|nr:hypothetical protein [Weizmannia acidilactici]
MDRKKLAMATVALGVVYLMRNKRSRSKLMAQLTDFVAPKK